MPDPKDAPLTIEQLECGLRVLGDGNSDLGAFWDEYIEPFRRTLIHAIRDTSDALLSNDIPLLWRIELESQLKDLARNVELTDRCLSARSSCGRRARAFPPLPERIH